MLERDLQVETLMEYRIDRISVGQCLTVSGDYEEAAFCMCLQRRCQSLCLLAEGNGETRSHVFDRSRKYQVYPLPS